ncbi:MAG: F0F1 ATP synthase subunit B [Elusimicrobiota bacterium]
MEYLLSPDTGLIVWTLATFLALVVLLSKFAWRPLLSAIEEREQRLRRDREAAEGARSAAEGLKSEYERQISAMDKKTQEILADARKQGSEIQASILRQAEKDSKELMEKTKQQMVLEKERLMKDVRSQVGTLSALAAERLLKTNVDAKSHERMVEEFFKDLEQAKG